MGEATRAVSAASLTWSEEGGITEEDLVEEVMAMAVAEEDTAAEVQGWAEDSEGMEDMGVDLVDPEEDLEVREEDLVVREVREVREDIMVVEEDSTDLEVVDSAVQGEGPAEDGRRASYA